MVGPKNPGRSEAVARAVLAWMCDVHQRLGGVTEIRALSNGSV